MAYDEKLANRVRRSLAGRRGVTERTMFGGLAFLVGGRMCCGIVGDTLMVRVGPEAYEAALARPHARVMDFTGRPLRGFVYVDPPGIASPAALKGWIARAAAFASTSKAKQGTRRTKRTTGRAKRAAPRSPRKKKGGSR